MLSFAARNWARSSNEMGATHNLLKEIAPFLGLERNFPADQHRNAPQVRRQSFRIDLPHGRAHATIRAAHSGSS